MKQLLLFLLLPVFCLGQGDQTIIKVPIDNSGTTEQAILHLPDDYSTATTTSYPIMIFLHGVGEGGTNPASIYNSSSAGGPSYFITQGKFPSSFVNPADKQSYKYIVLSPQSDQGWSTTAPQLDLVLTYMIQHYRINQSRVYLTGLSAGGEGIVEYVGQVLGTNVPVTTTHKIAAFIPMSAVMNGALEAGYATKIVAGNIGLWGFGSPADTHGANTLNLCWYVNNDKANAAISTSYSGGHCCWGQFYDPNFRQNGMSIYEWALQYTAGTGSSAPATAPSTPVFAPASGAVITLPASSLTISGSSTAGSGSTISGYAWTKVSGGAATIVSPTAAATVISGLAAGTYVFQLKVTASNSLTSVATVQVTVNPAPVSVPTADAGSNQTIQLPASQVTLNGSASTVANGSIASYAWSMQSGGAATIQSPSAASTVVSGLVAGSYVFSLKITDNTGKTSSANVSVTVNVNSSASAPPSGPSTPLGDAGDQSVVSVPTDKSGTTEQALVHLPDDYSSTTTKYPLLVFLHSESLGSTSPSTIYTNASAGGPAYFIAQGKFPSSFVNPVDKKSYKFIVVSPQKPIVGSNTAPELENILTYLYKTYRVDTSRVYLSGNAAGGGGVLEYVGNLLSTGVKVNVTHRIAAFVPMSAYMNAGVRPNYVDTIVNTNVHLWGFGSSAEMNGANTLGLDFLVNYAKNGYGVQTDYSGGLCCWGQFYDPNFKQNGMSIYEWCLQYSRGAAAASGLPIPGQIEAENFSAVSAGVQPQATTDAGGGVNLGWIYNGDWMDYTVNVAAAGQYKVSFRIAAPSAGNSCQLLNAAGAVLANVSLPNTGGWQTWQTVSTTVTLPAGNQVLRVKSISGSSWNFNWMQFASTTTTTANSTTAINAKALALGADSAAEMNSTLSLYPNPVQDQLNIQMNNNETGNMLVQVVDAQGGIRSVYNFSKTAGFSQVMLNTSNLPRGFYLIRITVGKISEVRKVIKM